MKAVVINEKRDIADWEKLSLEQQRGITDAIEEIDSGKGIAHETNMPLEIILKVAAQKGNENKV